MQTTQPQRSQSLKEKQRQEREQLILQVAEEVFTEKGYYETSMDEIAARVGIAKGTVYLHFPSKEDLIVAIIARDMQRFWEVIDETTKPQTGRTAREKLEMILHFMYSGFYCKRAQLLYSIYSDANLRRLFEEKKGQCPRMLWKDLAERITAVLEEGKAAGEFDKTIPTRVMLSVFFSLQSPKIYDRLVSGERMSSEELVKYLGRVYFDGVAVRREDKED